MYDLTGALTAFTLSAALQRDGEEPLYLLALLQNECRRMLAIKLLREEGLSPDAIASKIGAPPFAVRQLSGQVTRYTAEQLQMMSDACMETEYLVKSGRLPQEGALEKTMLQVLRIRTEGQL